MAVNELISIIERQIEQPLWGNWYIKERIGGGAFSAVYRVEAKRLNRTDVSALKIEPITASNTLFTDEQRKRSYIEERKKYIDAESSIMYNLKGCPNIVAYEEEDLKELYIDGKFEGYYFLIRMEMLTCLSDVIRSGKMDFSEKKIIELAKQIGRGIKAAHDIKVIHRDIKLDNFFISDDGIYKLGDFNVAKQSDRANTFAGTFGYLAPEIYRAKAGAVSGYTRQADIYSFGICLYQLMNDLCFPLEKHMSQEEAFDRRMRGERLVKPANASPGFSRIILKACAYDTKERYHTMNEMLIDIENYEAWTNRQNFDNFANNKAKNQPKIIENRAANKKNVRMPSLYDDINQKKRNNNYYNLSKNNINSNNINKNNYNKSNNSKKKNKKRKSAANYQMTIKKANIPASVPINSDTKRRTAIIVLLLCLLFIVLIAMICLVAFL